MEKKPLTEEQVDAHIKRCQEYFRDSLGGYIGDLPKKTPEAWSVLREQAQRWMDEMTKCCISVSFTHEGMPVTPEMIADWHFEPSSAPRTVEVKAVPKYPLGRIKVSLVLEEEEEEEDE